MQVSTMSYAEFKDNIRENIRDYLGPQYQDATVEIRTQVKNNDITLDGLAITRPDSIGKPVPQLYLNDFYKEASAFGHSMEDVLEKIANAHMSHDNLNLDMTRITDYSKAKDKIVPRLVNEDMNVEYLGDKPHQYVADLAVMYSIKLNNEMSVPVTDSLMKSWGITHEELHNTAVENLNTAVEPMFRGITGVLIDIGSELSDGMKEELRNSPDFMYVLGSGIGETYGAAQLLNSDIMDKVCDMFPDGFYIIPSSIHEALIVPHSQIAVESLEAMIRDVNATQLAPNEILSDHAYEYDHETRTITSAHSHEQGESQSQEQAHSQKRARALDMDMSH